MVAVEQAASGDDVDASAEQDAEVVDQVYLIEEGSSRFEFDQDPFSRTSGTDRSQFPRHHKRACAALTPNGNGSLISVSWLALSDSSPVPADSDPQQ